MITYADLENLDIKDLIDSSKRLLNLEKEVAELKKLIQPENLTELLK